jgi:hypothetical protein
MLVPRKKQMAIAISLIRIKRVSILVIKLDTPQIGYTLTAGGPDAIKREEVFNGLKK